MRVELRLRLLSDDGEKFFGEGPYRLLRGVERLGSLRAAANELGMAYSKASRIVGRAERELGFALTQKRIGGPDGGGSRLTPAAQALLARYEALRADCEAAMRASFARNLGSLPRAASEAFPGSTKADSKPDAPALGCAVLAAGRGERFGGGKLLAELGSRCVLARTLDALPRERFARIVAVTSDPAVSDLCRAAGIPVRAYPGGPLSDSIREALSAMDGTDGCMFVNGDQPLLRPASLRRLADAFAEAPRCAHRLAFRGTAASPVIVPAAAYPALQSLTGESGGMSVLRAGNWEIRTVEAEAPAELWDVDDKPALQRAEEYLRSATE